jgi:T5SS/PEP-CTERM-associated repeat protein
MQPIGRQGIRCILIVLLVVEFVQISPPSPAQLVFDGTTNNVLDGVSTNITSDIIVGDFKPRTLLVLTNGANISNPKGELIIGQSSSSSNNAVVITGGSAWTNGGTQVGNFGSANRLSILNGGAVSNAGVCTIGASSQSNVVLVADPGSLFRNGSIVLAAGGNDNQLIVSNGAVVTANSTSVQADPGSNNVIIVTGEGSLFTNQLHLQLGGSGLSRALTITDGAAFVNDIGYIGSSFGAGNRVLVDGPHSFWMNRDALQIGYDNNLIIITNGAELIDDIGYLGYGGSGNTVVVAGAGSLWTNAFGLYVGYSGSSSRLFITNGGSVVSPYTYVGGLFSSVSNQVIVAGPGSVWKSLGNISIGGNGDSLVISNSGTVIAPGLSMGSTNGFNLLISGGNLTASLGLSGPGALTLDSGLIAAEGLSLSEAAFDFRAGTVQLHESQVAGTSPFKIGDGARQATLELLNYGSHSFLSHSLVVSSNATLKGVGTIWASISVSNGATISPSPAWGLSVGSMIVAGNLLLSPGSTNLMGLNGNGNYARFDYFVGISNVTYGGTLLLTNIIGQLADGDSFRLFSASNYSGAFSAISPPSPGPGLKWNTNELNVDGVLRVFAVPTWSPKIVGSQVVATNIQIRTSGNIPYDPVFLLTTTDLRSSTMWVRCATNRFDWQGNALFEQHIIPNEPGRFFRLEVE